MTEAQDMLIRAADILREPEQNVFRRAYEQAFPAVETVNYKFHWDRYLRSGAIPKWVYTYCKHIVEQTSR